MNKQIQETEKEKIKGTAAAEKCQHALNIENFRSKDVKDLVKNTLRCFSKV